MKVSDVGNVNSFEVFVLSLPILQKVDYIFKTILIS